MSASADGDRAELWLPLLRRLTDATESWYVWKNAESALAARGDVDSAAPAEAWDRIERTFREWAADRALGHVVACRHIPRTLNLIAASEHVPDLLQLEVKGTTTLRGSTLFRAEELLPLTCLDPRGFRRLRPGAEGLFKFIMNGVHRGGRPHERGLAGKRVLELIEEDVEGMREAAAVFGAAEPWIVAAVEAARNGAWNRRALLKVELRAALRVLAEPWTLAERTWFRAARKPFCPLLKVIYRGRSAPPDLAGWLERVAMSHEVHAVGGPS